jgi:hypothetical protein
MSITSWYVASNTYRASTMAFGDELSRPDLGNTVGTVFSSSMLDLTSTNSAVINSITDLCNPEDVQDGMDTDFGTLWNEAMKCVRDNNH